MVALYSTASLIGGLQRRELLIHERAHFDDLAPRHESARFAGSKITLELPLNKRKFPPEEGADFHLLPNAAAHCV